MTADITRVRLPHTGLRVPDLALTITGIRQWEGPDTVAFKATLRRGKAIIARITNDGWGGSTCTEAVTTGVLDDLDTYAQQCLTEESDPLPALEHLIDALVDEHVWAGKVTDVAAEGRLPLRLMEHVVVGDDGDPIGGFPPHPTTWCSSTRPTQPKEWKALAEQLPTPGRTDWWQAWTSKGWRDVTRRPARVRSDLYA